MSCAKGKLGVHEIKGPILLTGANGFVGRATLKTIQSHGLQVKAVVRRRGDDMADAPGREWLVAPDGPAAVPGMLRGSHAVIHLAGRAHITKNEGEAVLPIFRSVNRDLALATYRAAGDAGVGRFVFVSTLGVLGRTPPSGGFDASSPAAPQEPYAIAKHEAESVLQEEAAKGGPELVIVRPPLVHGPGAPGNLRRLLRMVARGLPLPLGSVRNRRSMVGVTNLADLLLDCASHPAAAGRTFLAADDEAISTPDIIREMAQGMGRRAVLVPIPSAMLRLGLRAIGAGRIYDQMCTDLTVDAGEARRVLGWHPKETARAGIRAMAAAYAAAPSR